MKNFKYSLFILVLLATACKKEFLDKTPQIDLREEDALKSNDNFQTYAWGLYDYFDGYGNGGDGYPAYFAGGDVYTDDVATTLSGGQSNYASQTKVVPGKGSPSSSQAISRWDFSYIRRVNTMLDNVDKSEMTQTDKDHWRSVGYFFRALRYYDLIAAFGDVTWVEHKLTDTSALLFAPKTPRNIVAKNVLDNLIFAESHIKPDGQGLNTNTINVNCVRALISRFGLLEGTWRKYHALGDADVYLQACKTYSEKLLPTFPAAMSCYDDVYNLEDLGGQPGIILYKKYANNLTDHISGARFQGTANSSVDVTKDAVESYLCTDGRPIGSSAVYAGDNTMYNAFRNRDRRLLYTVVPPYKVTVGNPNYTWTKTANAADAEYINLFTTFASANPIKKSLPMAQWSASMQSGTTIGTSPHFRSFPGGQAQVVGELGYYYWKTYNRTPLSAKNSYATNDCPLLRIEEIWLNYAEVMYELGLFNQAVADQTINKLRPRAGLPNMVVSDITSAFDPNRDATVDPVLWEIRRERRVELLGDGFRFNDLKRWKKGTYINKLQLGVKVNNAEYGNKLSIAGGGPIGYVQFFNAPLGWLEKYYYEPIPTQELVLNKKLEQSQGWK